MKQEIWCARCDRFVLASRKDTVHETNETLLTEDGLGCAPVFTVESEWKCPRCGGVLNSSSCYLDETIALEQLIPSGAVRERLRRSVFSVVEGPDVKLAVEVLDVRRLATKVEAVVVLHFTFSVIGSNNVEEVARAQKTMTVTGEYDEART